MAYIINGRGDLDAAPKDVRDRFLSRLASTINKYTWDGSDWNLTQDESSIQRFGFTADDFPNAPVPEKPNYDPDERELKQRSAQIRQERDDLLVMRVDPIVSNPLRYEDLTETEKQEIRDYRTALLDVPQQTGFPNDVDWPAVPSALQVEES